MNKEQQRIAIAEACGLGSREQLAALLEDYEEAFALAYYNDRAAPTTPIPDYLYDLNAMHEAEKELYARPNKSDGTVWAYVYESHLINITTTEIIATAAQRAEAFLKTIGKWEDGN